MSPSEARARAHQIVACAIRSAHRGDVSARDANGDPLTSGDTERVRETLLSMTDEHERLSRWIVDTAPTEPACSTCNDTGRVDPRQGEPGPADSESCDCGAPAAEES